MTDVDTKKELKATSRDYWELSGLVFVTGGFRWGVDYFGENVCMGRVGGSDISQNGGVACPVAQKGVTKIVDGGIIPPADTQVEKTGIMLHEKRGRGRPEKQGEVTRMTTWRREKKAKQGVLF